MTKKSTEFRLKLTDLCPAVFGINLRRYYQLMAEGVVPKAVKSTVDVIEATKMLIAYKDKLLEGTGSLALVDERTRLTHIQADRKQLELDRLKGELISTYEAMTIWGSILQIVKTRATSIPTKLAPLVYGREMPEIKTILERHIDEILNEWSNPDLEEVARIAASKGDASNTKTRAKGKYKRVGRPRKGIKPGR